jgi:hypothetical protein
VFVRKKSEKKFDPTSVTSAITRTLDCLTLLLIDQIYLPKHIRKGPTRGRAHRAYRGLLIAVPTVVEESEGDGGQVATMAGIAARQVRRLIADGQSEDDDPRGGARRAMGAVNALDCGDGRGIAGATMTTTMGGPGNDDVKAVGRFARAGRQ